MVGNTVKDTINIDYEAIIEEVHFEIITKKSTTFIKNQIASQLDTPLINKKRHITNFAKI